MSSLHVWNGTEDVCVALCEASPSLRSAFQTVLYRAGLRRIEICKDSESLLALMKCETVDLAICPADLPGPNFCDVMRFIRHKTVGNNPFVQVIATVEQPDFTIVRQLINSGVDRVLCTPLTMGTIKTNVESMMRSRKPFVATADYVGPSRRGIERFDQDLELLVDAPNTLRVKREGRVTQGAMRMMIDEGVNSLFQVRAVTSNKAVYRALRRLTDGLALRKSGAMLGGEIDRLLARSQDMERINRDMSNDHIAEIAASLTLLTQMIRILPPTSTPFLVAVELLQKLGEVIVNVGRDVADSTAVIRVIAEAARHFALTDGGRMTPAAISSCG